MSIIVGVGLNVAAVLLASTAIINGATSLKDVIKIVKARFLPVMRVCGLPGPLDMAYLIRF